MNEEVTTLEIETVGLKQRYIDIEDFNDVSGE